MVSDEKISKPANGNAAGTVMAPGIGQQRGDIFEEQEGVKMNNTRRRQTDGG